jgi:hypothetical protein
VVDPKNEYNPFGTFRQEGLLPRDQGVRGLRELGKRVIEHYVPRETNYILLV